MADAEKKKAQKHTSFSHLVRTRDTRCTICRKDLAAEDVVGGICNWCRWDKTHAASVRADEEDAKKRRRKR